MTARLSLLNRQRKAARSRMAHDAKAYATASTKMFAEMEKLSKNELGAFLKKNPDVLIDLGGGLVAKAGGRIKAAAAGAIKEWRAELQGKVSRAATKGKKRVISTRAKLEDKALGYLKKALSL